MVVFPPTCLTSERTRIEQPENMCRERMILRKPVHDHLDHQLGEAPLYPIDFPPDPFQIARLEQVACVRHHRTESRHRTQKRTRSGKR